MIMLKNFRIYVEVYLTVSDVVKHLQEELGAFDEGLIGALTNIDQFYQSVDTGKDEFLIKHTAAQRYINGEPQCVTDAFHLCMDLIRTIEVRQDWIYYPGTDSFVMRTDKGLFRMTRNHSGFSETFLSDDSCLLSLYDSLDTVRKSVSVFTKEEV